MNNKNVVWLVTILVAGYICFQLVADVSAAKMVHLFGVDLPAGSMVFALTFTWRDLIHKRLGREWARAAIFAAAVANVFMALYFMMAIELPFPSFWDNQEAFNAIVGIVPRITIASIIAELISELLDTEIYHMLMHRIPARHQWFRVMGSNGIAVPVDSAVFATLAFAGTMSAAGIWSIIWGQIVFKWIVTMVSIPFIYTVKEKPLEPVLPETAVAWD